MASTPTFSGVLFGAAYYAEYQPALDLDRDLDLMADAGFTVIRVGESVWSTWEPREGVFALDWLRPVLDGAQRRGIGVILGTPTYAVPPWLQRMHPEIAAEVRTGERLGWGHRQEMDQSSPAYRFYAERVTRRILERYAAHPSVIGFQVDNEPGFRMPHNESVFQRFVAWLQNRYGTVERLNSEWGLVHWSHRLSDWADLWRPDGNTQPQYNIEWRRFQAGLADELIGWQTRLVREYARRDQFITTCLSYSRAQVSDDEIVAGLDVVAGNPYYRMQDGLDIPTAVEAEELWWSSGVWALHQWGDRAFSSAQAPYLVTETNAQSVGNTSDSFPPYPGQLRQAAFALLSRGGRMIEYWHWHTLHFGTETYWGGVLPHSGKPGRIYREVAALGADIRGIGDLLDGYEPDSDVLMVYSTDTKWAFEFDPPLRKATGGPDDRAYATIFDAFYRGLFDAGVQTRIRHTRQLQDIPVAELVARHPIMVVPALYIADDQVLETLAAYAEQGGHLVLGIRSGYGDHLARARAEEAPARLTSAAGISYEESSTLTAELGVTGSDGFVAAPGAAGREWMDVLQVSDADVIAEYAVNELGSRAAVTTRAHGRGRVTYVGTVPNTELARAVGAWLVPDTARQRWAADEATTVVTGRTGDREVSFVANWSGERATVSPPGDVRDVLTGELHSSGAPLLLEPRAALLFEASSDRPVG
ncbi:beta-galactosidase [Microbacterium sp. NPDC089320]|uniref:beta-galactosidase n=1 Tax=Microbacterium sp. NPDC089320 TaxID=3155182 RepID=UPI003421E7C8